MAANAWERITERPDGKGRTVYWRRRLEGTAYLTVKRQPDGTWVWKVRTRPGGDPVTEGTARSVQTARRLADTASEQK